MKLYRDYYIVWCLIVLGLFAGVTALIVSWPAIAYIASKFM